MDYLFVNQSAGSARDADYWLTQLKAVGLNPTVCVDDDLDEKVELTEADRFLVAGGDGTVNRYAGLCREKGCTLGVLPAGTGNDFARGLDIPLEPDRACEVIAGGLVRQVDIAFADEHRFLNVAHIGLGSEISRSAQDETKRWWGRFSYIKTLLAKIEQRRGFKALIECDGTRRRGRWLSIAIANGRSFGGGHEVFEASPDDGELNVIAVRPYPLWQLIKVWSKAQIQGATPNDRAIVKMSGRKIEVRSRSPKQISADGEPAGSIPVSFDVEHRALRVLVPDLKDATDSAK